MKRVDYRIELPVAGRTDTWLPSLRKLTDAFPQAATLPLSLKILLLNLLVRFDGRVVTEAHIMSIVNWDANATNRDEVPFTPGRVVLQDFTGVPAIVDLAALREKLLQGGGEPALVDPQVRVDVVIDHSVQVDVAGTSAALDRNRTLEYDRNVERYALLRWASGAFKSMRTVRPGFGIVHQVNLEYLACGVSIREDGCIDLDTVVGTDSHTPHINGLGVVGWGVGGIEAEAAMLGHATPFVLPDVIGLKVVGKLPIGSTPTDVVLYLTKLLRDFGVVDKFVELFGPGVATLSVPDRAMLGNMSPEMGATIVLSPTDEQTILFLERTNRAEDARNLRAYAEAQGIFGCPTEQGGTRYSQVVTLDLSNVVPAVAGPCQPQQHVPLAGTSQAFRSAFVSTNPEIGFSRNPADLDQPAVSVTLGGKSHSLRHAAVVIAAITSCTNTSNPTVMMGAGLLAQKADALGLKVAWHVKTSLAPGSRVVTAMLDNAGLSPALNRLGFQTVGYGCTTCIGNSGSLAPEIEAAIQANKLSTTAVLSGNRNFKGRVHQLVDGAFLMSPPLVIAFAIAGTTDIDLTTTPLGIGSNGQPVFLRDIWPTEEEVAAAVASAFRPEAFALAYGDAFGSDSMWDAVPAPTGAVFEWDPNSTYVQYPPFFDTPAANGPIKAARVLGLFGDGITTDHISPAGAIAKDSPAGRWLLSQGVQQLDFNQYGARRGNFKVMARGTFANIKLRNLLVTETGNLTLHHPTGEKLSFFDAAARYTQAGTPVVIIAGKRYGSGSSRDWAAKGPALLGIRAVIAESYERIHRSNLVGCGIVPLEFLAGENAKSLGLTGAEEFDIDLSELAPRGFVTVNAGGKTFQALVRIDNPVELEYWQSGGVLRFVLERLAA